MAMARVPSSVVSTFGSTMPPGASIVVRSHDSTAQPYRATPRSETSERP